MSILKRKPEEYSADRQTACFVAMTDLNNVFGLVKFYRKAMAAGVKPVIGLDLRIFNDDEPNRPFTLLLLVQNADGYRNLSQLVTRSFIEGQVRGEPMARREWLTADSCVGLIAVSGADAESYGKTLEQFDESCHGAESLGRALWWVQTVRTR